ncbi:MAG: GIY-YIG nuclease family protein [Granulosicoccaceae bacterium]
MKHPIPAEPGTYVLVFESQLASQVSVGALGNVSVTPGFYLYVGSAHGGGGLQARISRHLSCDKPLRWHMDYLRPKLNSVEVWWQASEERLESAWVEAIPELEIRPHHKGFGASDSPHFSHLFYSSTLPPFHKWRVLNPRCNRYTIATTSS